MVEYKKKLVAGEAILLMLAISAMVNIKIQRNYPLTTKVKKLGEEDKRRDE
jgi:hypothetical protein